MDLETHVVIRAVERTLALSALGRERWCVEWAKWLWAQEIEIAVHHAKQPTPERHARARMPIAADLSLIGVGLTAGPLDRASLPRRLVHHRGGEPPPE